MKNIVILLSLSLLFFGCTKDWGTPVTKNYPINGAYTKLDVSNAFEVTVSDQVTDVVVTVGELAHDRVTAVTAKMVIRMNIAHPAATLYSPQNDITSE